MGIYLESFNAAATNYGLKRRTLIEDFPLLSFQFLVIFNTNVGRVPRQLPVLVQEVSIGQPTWDMKEANHYNYRRQYKTRIQYPESSITILDVVDGKTIRLLKNYYEYYNHDHTGTRFGYNLERVNVEDAFFESIEIYQWQFPVANLTVLQRPKISGTSGQTLSSSGSDPVTITIAFKPEWVEYYPRIAAPQIQTSGNSDR